MNGDGRGCRRGGCRVAGHEKGPSPEGARCCRQRAALSSRGLRPHRRMPVRCDVSLAADLATRQGFIPARWGGVGSGGRRGGCRGCVVAVCAWAGNTRGGLRSTHAPFPAVRPPEPPCWQRSPPNPCIYALGKTRAGRSPGWVNQKPWQHSRIRPNVIGTRLRPPPAKGAVVVGLWAAQLPPLDRALFSSWSRRPESLLSADRTMRSRVAKYRSSFILWLSSMAASPGLL